VKKLLVNRCFNNLLARILISMLDRFFKGSIKTLINKVHFGLVVLTHERRGKRIASIIAQVTTMQRLQSVLLGHFTDLRGFLARRLLK
jgi:hypothetical protein